MDFTRYGQVVASEVSREVTIQLQGSFLDGQARFRVRNGVLRIAAQYVEQARDAGLPRETYDRVLVDYAYKVCTHVTPATDFKTLFNQYLDESSVGVDFTRALPYAYDTLRNVMKKIAPRINN